MRLLRAFIIILGLMLFTNDNLSSDEERFFSAEVHTQNDSNKINSFDNLVNSFDAAIINGTPEVFIEEIKEPTASR